MSIATSAAEQRVIMQPVSWATYTALSDEVTVGRGRMAYCRGVLEIMSPSKLHESVGCLIGRLVEAFTEERGIELCSVASTTFRREDLKVGFEADESYYIGDVAAVLGKDEIDLTIDPPPDLVIEVDISRSSMRKFPIYGNLRVPEVWRFHGQTLRMYVHREREVYDEVPQSEVLPGMSVRDLTPFLQMQRTCGETQILRSFRQWVRNHPT